MDKLHARVVKREREREIYKSFRNSVARTRATQSGKIIWIANDFLVDLLFSTVNLPMNYRTIVSTIVLPPRSLFAHDRVDKFIDFKFNLNLCETIFHRLRTRPWKREAILVKTRRGYLVFFKFSIPIFFNVSRKFRVDQSATRESTWLELIVGRMKNLCHFATRQH